MNEYTNPAPGSAWSGAVAAVPPSINGLASTPKPSAGVPVQTIERDLFAQEDDPSKTVAQSHMELAPHERALRAIERVLIAGHVVVCAFSSGKDSSCVANLMLNAAINVKAAGHRCPQLVISHADTGVESPVVRALADGELQKMRDFAREHGLPLQVLVGKPTLSACFATRIIGGRALPPFPQSRTDCSTDWKIAVTERNIRRVVGERSEGEPAVVTLIGTRSSESAARKMNTAKRKETAHEVWYSDDGEARLSPILDWDTDTVWEYLGMCAAGEFLSYSDFGDTMQFYANAGASSCVVVADMRSASNNKACGARGGCFSCTAVAADRSVENMIEQNPGRYPYLVPLLELRNFIADTAWDWSLRNYLGRTISPQGTMKVGADQYSPQMVEDLLYYTLAAQARANELGSPSVVQAIGVRELVAIDFYWSLRGWHPPFHALAIYLDHCAGNRRYAPKVQRPATPSPAPVIGEIYVGKDWDDNLSKLFPSGLRHHSWEIFSESCGPMLRSNKAGKVFLDLEEAPEFDVDAQAAWDFIEFVAEEKIEQYHRQDTPDWTIAAMTYIQYGTVTLATGQSSAIDSMIRRTQWLQRHGLHGHQTAESLRARCSSLVETQAELFA